MTFYFFFQNFRLIGPKISESENPKAQNVLISAFFSGFEWKNANVRQNSKKNTTFMKNPKIFKEYNHPKKRRQIQVRSLVMKNIRLKPVMTSSAIRVLR